jgi:hypothetical protein
MYRIARRVMNAGDISIAAHLFPFSSLVFASWDFHLSSLEVRSTRHFKISKYTAETYYCAEVG